MIGAHLMKERPFAIVCFDSIISETASLGGPTARPGGNPGNPQGRFYVRNMMVPFTADNCHDIRPPLNIKQASVRTLAKVGCYFLAWFGFT